MGMLMIAIAIGYFVGFSVFLVCEEKSLKNANFSDMKDVFSEELKFEECSRQFSTIKYMLVFVVIVAILAFLVGMYILPAPLTLAAIVAYMLFPSAIGSLIILLVKWRYQPFIKFVSSFLFGAGYMTGSGLGLGFLYAMNNNFFMH
jgi:hypothetical protein